MKSHLKVTIYNSSEDINARHRSEKYLTIFLFGKSNKTVLSEYVVMVIPGILLGCFHYWDDVWFVGRVGGVYWVIWDSRAWAAHSGAAARIFSRRLLTWKHRDWICLSQVGRASRAVRTWKVERASNTFAFYDLWSTHFHIQMLCGILSKHFLLQKQGVLFSYHSCMKRVPPTGRK